MNKCIAVAALCCLIMGCSGGSGGAPRVTTHKVTGKVTFNGTPVANANVTFSPTGPGIPSAMGLSDTQGMYTLTTYDAGDGAAAGTYKVMVYKTAPKAENSAPQHDPTGKTATMKPQGHGGKAGAAGGGGSLLPEKYASADTPLQKTVNEGENTIDLAL
jgi:hypothetical protein